MGCRLVQTWSPLLLYGLAVSEPPGEEDSLWVATENQIDTKFPGGGVGG